MVKALVVTLLLAGCSGKSRPPGDAAQLASHDGASAPPAIDGAAVATGGAPDDAAGAPTPDAAPTTGELQIRVEWKDAPVVARASAGPTPCATPRAPAVAPTTLWGIPDVLVFVAGARPPGAATDAPARIRLVDCALTPRLAAAGSLELTSTFDRPTHVTLARRGTTEAVLAGTLEKAAPQPVRLPIAGHTVALTLEPDAVYELATADPAPETAWIATGAAATTDSAGLATIAGVSPGSHRVTAWLPPRAGRPARIARGAVDVAAGTVSELTLQLE